MTEDWINITEFSRRLGQAGHPIDRGWLSELVKASSLQQREGPRRYNKATNLVRWSDGFPWFIAYRERLAAEIGVIDEDEVHGFVSVKEAVARFADNGITIAYSTLARLLPTTGLAIRRGRKHYGKPQYLVPWRDIFDWYRVYKEKHPIGGHTPQRRRPTRTHGGTRAGAGRKAPPLWTENELEQKPLMGFGGLRAFAYTGPRQEPD